MRFLCILFLLFTSAAFADEPERDLPFALGSPRGYKAILTDFTPKELKYYIGTAIKIKSPHGKIIFCDRSSLYLKRAVNAGWSPSGDYLVIASVNGEGHSPWRHYIHIFSVRDRRMHFLKAPSSSAFTSGKITFDSPNLLRLVYGFYGELQADAIDAPKDFSYDLSQNAKQ